VRLLKLRDLGSPPRIRRTESADSSLTVCPCVNTHPLPVCRVPRPRALRVLTEDTDSSSSSHSTSFLRRRRHRRLSVAWSLPSSLSGARPVKPLSSRLLFLQNLLLAHSHPSVFSRAFPTSFNGVDEARGRCISRSSFLGAFSSWLFFFISWSIFPIILLILLLERLFDSRRMILSLHRFSSFPEDDDSSFEQHSSRTGSGLLSSLFPLVLLVEWRSIVVSGFLFFSSLSSSAFPTPSIRRRCGPCLASFSSSWASESSSSCIVRSFPRPLLVSSELSECASVQLREELNQLRCRHEEEGDVVSVSSVFLLRSLRLGMGSCSWCSSRRAPEPSS